MILTEQKDSWLVAVGEHKGPGIGAELGRDEAQLPIFWQGHSPLVVLCSAPFRGGNP